MHTEHKTLKWCAVVLALIIAIAGVAVIIFQTEPAAAPVTVEIKTAAEQQSAAIKAMPDEMADLTSDHDISVLEKAPEEETLSLEDLVPAGAPVNVTIKVDGIEMDLMAAPAAVKTVLKNYGIPVDADDLVQPALDQKLTEGTQIIIQRIVFEEVVESEAVPFEEKVEGTDQLPAGTEKVEQEGQNGEDKVTFKVTYADGKEIAREEISRERVKDPVTKIIKKSTVGTIKGAEYSRKFTVKAYSYTGGGRTASGLSAAVGRIAVDPSVIPLGTRVYVEGYGFATAADTGGNIKGNTIDVYYNSLSQCRSWGSRHVTIYILK